MAANDFAADPVVWEIEGYVREIANVLHPLIIPSDIKEIIYMFYPPVPNPALSDSRLQMLNL